MRRVSSSAALILAVLLAAAAAGGWFVLHQRDVPMNPVIANGQPQVTLVDFALPFSLDSLPAGWTHRKFWTRPAMQLSFTAKDNMPALRCETNAGGSILGRWTDIGLADFPVLRWRWFVETPIASTVDERTPAGDDHPVRWFLAFTDSEGAAHHAEIIWGDKLLKRGDWKIIGTFVHFVADGGDANIGQWREEIADLMSIYRRASGRNDSPRLTQLAIFCDSDDTKGHTVAYVGGPVTLGK